MNFTLTEVVAPCERTGAHTSYSVNLESESSLKGLSTSKWSRKAKGYMYPKEIKKPKQSCGKVKLSILQGANRVADGLAALGCNLQEENHYVLYESPPASVKKFVDDDVIGVSTPRIVLV